MLLCYFGVHFGDPHTMVPYHAIGHFLCIGCALCKHEFYTLETQKVWLSWVGAVFRLALGLYASWLSFLVFFCVCEIDESTRQLETIRVPSMKLPKHLVWNIDQCAWELFSVPGLALAPKFKWTSAWLVECNIPLYLYAWTVLQTRF